MAGGGVGGSGGAAGAAGASNGKVEHRFVSGISDGGPVALVATDGHIEWQFDVAGEANDAWYLPNGDVVFAYKTGAREVAPDKRVVWSYAAPAGSEIHSCQPLANGFLLGEAHDGGVGYLREVDTSGKLQKTVTINVGGALGAHSQFREVRKTAQGTYLVTYLDLGKAREVDADGKLLREFPCGSFVAIRLKDGNTLVSCGDDHRVIEVDPQGSVVWQVTQQEIPGNQLGFAAGLQRLPNGNTIICNWPGHGGVPANQPQAFELTRDKRVVWQLRNPALKLVSNLEVIDPDGAIDGVVYR
jgi:outer membrane protein assembly factor BamB